MSGTSGTLPVRTMLAAIRGYKVLVSPLFTGSCRYLPSCSDYMADAVRHYGVLRGGWLGLKRLGRCQPWGGHGFDPVPETLPPFRLAWSFGRKVR